MSTFIKIYRDFFKKSLRFLCNFCVYRPKPIQDVATDPTQRLPSRRTRPRLWTMV